MKKIIQFTYLVLGLMLFSTGCTKLDEEVFSQIQASNFYNNKVEVTAVVLRPYPHIGASIGSYGGQRTHFPSFRDVSGSARYPAKGCKLV